MAPTLPPQPVPNKYRNLPTWYEGVRYDSIAEAKRAEYLFTLLDAKALDWVIIKPPFRLGVPENRYIADFLVSEGGKVRAEDVKGRETPKFRKVRELWESYGLMPLWIIKAKHTEVLMPYSINVIHGG